MFAKTKTIIAITKGKIVGAKVKTKGKKKIKKVIELGWEYKTFDVALAKLVKELRAKTIRVLIGDEFSYVLRLKVPSNLRESEEREFIAKKISEQIPEELGDNEWDYKEFHFSIAPKKETKEAEQEVIVFSLVKGFFKVLSEAVGKLDLKVEAIEPSSVAKTRHENPLVGLAIKDDIRGKDENVLNLKPLEIEEIEERNVIGIEKEETLLVDEANKARERTSTLVPNIVAEMPSQDKQEKRTKKSVKGWKIILFLALLLAIVAALALTFYNPAVFKIDKLSSISETQETVNVQPESTIVEQIEEIDLSEFTVQIQNGTGVAGEANYVSDILLAEGFTDLASANAESYDYADTEVSLKEFVSEKVYDNIERALNSDYSIVKSDEVLSGESEFDVLIIIGTKIVE
jgi:hypothetical protein